ncbi:hypothetical protein H1C71_041754, partial [Ictidomys tridecemlineatus]
SRHSFTTLCLLTNVAVSLVPETRSLHDSMSLRSGLGWLPVLLRSTACFCFLDLPGPAPRRQAGPEGSFWCLLDVRFSRGRSQTPVAPNYGGMCQALLWYH